MMVKTSKRMLLNMDGNILVPLKIVRCSGNEVEGDHDKIDNFNSYEGNDDSPEAPDEQIFAQKRVCSQRSVTDSLKGHRDKEWNNECVKNNRGKDCGGRGVQLHDVNLLQPWQSAGEKRWNNRKVFRDVIGDREGRQSTSGHQELLADFDDFNQLGGVAVEVHHVRCFFGGLGPSIHRQGDVSLSQGWGIIGSISHHGNQLTSGLLFA